MKKEQTISVMMCLIMLFSFTFINAQPATMISGEIQTYSSTRMECSQDFSKEDEKLLEKLKQESDTAYKKYEKEYDTLYKAIQKDFQELESKKLSDTEFNEAINKIYAKQDKKTQELDKKSKIEELGKKISALYEKYQCSETFGTGNMKEIPQTYSSTRMECSQDFSKEDEKLLEKLKQESDTAYKKYEKEYDALYKAIQKDFQELENKKLSDTEFNEAINKIYAKQDKKTQELDKKSRIEELDKKISALYEKYQCSETFGTGNMKGIPQKTSQTDELKESKTDTTEELEEEKETSTFFEKLSSIWNSIWN